MTVTTNDRGQQNMWATEPTMYMTKEDLDKYGIETHNEKAEKLNGRVAMLGGLLIGLIETMWSGYVSIEYKDVAAFSVLIITLIFFPTGFLGKPDIEKV